MSDRPNQLGDPEGTAQQPLEQAAAGLEGAPDLPMDDLLSELLEHWQGDEEDFEEESGEPVEAGISVSALMGRLLGEESEPSEEAAPEVCAHAAPPAEAEDTAPIAEPPMASVCEVAPPAAVLADLPAEEPPAEPLPPDELELAPVLPAAQDGEAAGDGTLARTLGDMRQEMAAGPRTSASRAVLATASRFLCFEMAGESYAVPLTRVLETDRLPRVTRVPGLPPFVRGVANLRGSVLAVVDLRMLLGVEAPPPAREERILVAWPAQPAPQGAAPVALVVDALAGVAALEDSELHATPQWLDGRVSPLLKGIGSHKGKLLNVLDLDRVFTSAEI